MSNYANTVIGPALMRVCYCRKRVPPSHVATAMAQAHKQVGFLLSPTF